MHDYQSLIAELNPIIARAANASLTYWGRQDKNQSDLLAVNAIRDGLNQLPNFNGKIIIGEGEKDDAPQLYNGEIVGNKNIATQFDIAVDPLECTTYLAKGFGNSLSVLALSPRGTMMDVGPSFYMDKIAYGVELKGKIDPYSPIVDQITLMAKIKGKDIRECFFYILNKERHQKIIADILSVGARVMCYSSGDVTGALLSMLGNQLPANNVDGLLGIGGTPEGILTAVAANAIGGEYFGRFAPQSTSELDNVKKFGLNTEKFYSAQELVQSNDGLFIAAGITPGLIHRDGIFNKIVPIMNIIKGKMNFVNVPV